jgi:hypothetical protein
VLAREASIFVVGTRTTPVSEVDCVRPFDLVGIIAERSDLHRFICGTFTPLVKLLLLGLFVVGFSRERISTFVLLARDPFEFDIQLVSKATGVLPEREKARTADGVLTGQLSDHELRVPVNGYGSARVFYPCVLKSCDKRFIFGDVVRYPLALSDVPTFFVDDFVALFNDESVGAMTTGIDGLTGTVEPDSHGVDVRVFTEGVAHWLETGFWIGVVRQIVRLNERPEIVRFRMLPLGDSVKGGLEYDDGYGRISRIVGVIIRHCLISIFDFPCGTDRVGQSNDDSSVWIVGRISVNDVRPDGKTITARM